MGFVDNLASNPSSGIYGQPKQQSDEDVLGIVNQLKDREMRDFQTKANFMSDLSLKQDRLRQLYDPTSARTASKGILQNQLPESQVQQPQQQMQQTKDPNQMDAYQKGELGIRQQGVNLESQKLAQSGKLGQEAIDNRVSQEKLNQQKSDQINLQKQNDMQRKADEAAAKIQQQQAELERKTKSGEDTLQAHKDLAASVEERHKLEMAMKQHEMDTKDEQFKTLQKQHQDLIDQKGRTKTTTEVNADGTKKTTTTERGSAADTIKVKGKDGQTYEIPKDKEDEWNQNHKPDEPQGDENN